MTTYLLLGASGFLGSEVLCALEQGRAPPRVVAVSRHPPLRPVGTATTWRQVDLVFAPVREYASLLRSCRPDGVVNCVGCTTGTPEQLQAANVDVVHKLVQALAQYDPVPFVHLGSAAEYGRQPQGLPVKETAVPRPRGPYGRSKLEATDLVVDHAASGAIRGTVLRVFNPVGPGSPATSLAGNAAREIQRAQAAHRTYITLGPLWPHRDFLATVDVGRAVIEVLRSIETHPLLNVGRGVAMSCRSMVELLANAAGFEGSVFESEGALRRTEGVPWQQADITSLRHHLHWVPTTSIAEAVAALWQSRR